MIDFDSTPQDELFARLMRRVPLPELVFHYTTGQGLVGIGRSRRIWATDLRYLNDSLEFTYALGLLQQLLAIFQHDKSVGFPEELMAEWMVAFQALPRVQVFVASFCEDGDLLSQWRGYGGVSGYAVGLDPGRLRTAVASFDQPGALFPCVYDFREQLELIREALLFLLDEYVKGESSRALLDDFGTHFFAHMLVLASCFKHPNFAEEREWRLVFRSDPEGLTVPLLHRMGASMLLPYIEVPLATDSESNWIRRLVVGPAPHQTAAADSAEGLLRTCGCPETDVWRAQVPFRNW